MCGRWRILVFRGGRRPKNPAGRTGLHRPDVHPVELWIRQKIMEPPLNPHSAEKPCRPKNSRRPFRAWGAALITNSARVVVCTEGCHPGRGVEQKTLTTPGRRPPGASHAKVKRGKYLSPVIELRPRSQRGHLPSGRSRSAHISCSPGQ